MFYLTLGQGQWKGPAHVVEGWGRRSELHSLWGASRAKDSENDTRPLGHSILNKCFVSVPSLLFITNKYLSTESLVPRCYTVLHYYCGPAVWLPARLHCAQTLPVSFSLLERERESTSEREGDIYACPACLPVPFKQVSCQVICLMGFAVHKLRSHTPFSLFLSLALCFSCLLSLMHTHLKSPFLSLYSPPCHSQANTNSAEENAQAPLRGDMSPAIFRLLDNYWSLCSALILLWVKSVLKPT